MRSRLVERWLGLAGVSSSAPATRRANGRVADEAAKGRQVQASPVMSKRPQRICLGIGDGSVHRQ